MSDLVGFGLLLLWAVGVGFAYELYKRHPWLDDQPGFYAFFWPIGAAWMIAAAPFRLGASLSRARLERKNRLQMTVKKMPKLDP